MFCKTTQYLTALVAVGAVGVLAQVPAYEGLSVLWSDDFRGDSGSSVNGELWKTIDRNMGINAELQTYSKSPKNAQLSGGDTLQLVPWLSPEGWTSGRIESLQNVMPEPGKITRVEASLRMGDNAAASKQGIWPAFWLLGQSMREGTGCK